MTGRCPDQRCLHGVALDLRCGRFREHVVVPFARHHATLFVDPAVSGPIEDLRRRWDPEMAGQIAAHVTLVYPWEAPDPELIGEWVRRVASEQPPFRLRLGPLDRHDSAEGVGCGYAVLDVDGGHSALRARIASSKFARGDVDPHVTVVHPRTSRLGEAAWSALRTHLVEAEFLVIDIAITAWDGTAWPTLERIPLTG